MDSDWVLKVMEIIASGLEIIGVATIAFAFVHAMVRAALHFHRKREDAFERLKRYLGKALQLGLEFLVASDIIRTVSITPTRESILTLGLLIAVRTLLSWSITVEIEGCWPWRVAERKREEGT